ncbi:uncharacterized protein [Clytia hemisphaerica]|eukprot:TCONS_00006726-protein
MKFWIGFIGVLFVIDVSVALTAKPVTGVSPPPITCPKSLCINRTDGNYAYQLNGAKNDHYFLQCSGGEASCQPCFPQSLVFKEECNQCLTSLRSECVDNGQGVPLPEYFCPDKCGREGLPEFFTGNIEDPYNPEHYVVCLAGKLAACIKCPEGLEFNEMWNACLYSGKYKTEPTQNIVDNESDFI